MPKPITEEDELKMRAAHDYLEALFPNFDYCLILASDDDIPQVDIISNVDIESGKILADIAFEGVEEGVTDPLPLLQ